MGLYFQNHTHELLHAGSVLLKILPAYLVVVIGFKGLKTWRDQLHGTAEYEVARKILKAVFGVRDAVRYVRLSGSGFGEGDPQPGQDTVVVAYDTRYQELQKARRELELVLLDGEVAWGDKLKEPTQDLSKLTAQLIVAIRHFIASRLNDQDKELFDRATDGKILWGGEGDNYDNELTKVVQTFGDLVRPHLKK